MDTCEAILHLQYDCVVKDFVLSDQSDDKIRAQRVFYTNHLVLAQVILTRAQILYLAP